MAILLSKERDLYWYGSGLWLIFDLVLNIVIDRVFAMGIDLSLSLLEDNYQIGNTLIDILYDWLLIHINTILPFLIFYLSWCIIGRRQHCCNAIEWYGVPQEIESGIEVGRQIAMRRGWWCDQVRQSDAHLHLHGWIIGFEWVWMAIIFLILFWPTHE